MRRWSALFLCSMVAGALPRALGAQQSVPIVTLPAAAATSTETFGSIVSVRELPGGRLLVDDAARRQVKLLERTLQPGAIVFDSVRGPNFYGVTNMSLAPYRGDSTLFPEPLLNTVAVLGPDGTVARTLAMPVPRETGQLRRAGVDDTGRIIYSASPAVVRHSQPGGVPPAVADSTPLLRADLALRRTDTVGYITRPLIRTDAIRPSDAPGRGQTLIANGTSLAPNASIMSYWSADPLGMIDEWAVLTDGSVAIVRGHDYHIDWIRPDGTTASTPKLPFDWRQLTDADKEKMIDSAQTLRVIAARNNTLINGVDMAGAWNVLPGDAAPGLERLRLDVDTVGALYSKNNAGGSLMILPAARPTADHVFDYYPPLRSGAAMADMDDHLWILPTTSKQSKAGELVYDVVNIKGELFERVRVPLGRYIVGFGRGGVVYLATGSMAKGFTIERSTLPTAR